MCCISLAALLSTAIVLIRGFINSHVIGSDNIILLSGCSPLESAILVAPHVLLLAAWRMPARWRTALLIGQALLTALILVAACFVLQQYGLSFWSYRIS